MSDEITVSPQNVPANGSTLSFTYNPAANATVASNYYIPWTSPTYTTGYMYAQLTEQQLSDLESRMSQVVRKEITHTLSLVLSALSDGEDEEDEE